MSMTQLSDHRWRFRLTYRKRNYSMYYEALPTLTNAQAKKEARKQYDYWEAMIKAGKYQEEKKILLFDLITNVYNEHVLINLKVNSQVSFETSCNLHIMPFFGNVYINDISTYDIQRFANDLVKNYKMSTVRHILSSLRSVLDFGVKWGYLKESPFNHIQLKKEYKKTNTELLSFEQIDILFNYYLNNEKNLMHRAIFMIAFGTGLRLGEILALTTDDIDFRNNTINVDKQTGRKRDKEGNIYDTVTSPKTLNSIRKIYAPRFVMDAIKACCKAQPTTSISKQIFLSQYSTSNKPMSRVTVYNYFVKNLNSLGLPHISFHDLRHLQATTLVQHGANIKAISTRLGHAQVDLTLNTYTSNIESMDKQLANQLDSIFYNVNS